MRIDIQQKILKFLKDNKGKRFSVVQIWEELNGQQDISYNLVQTNIQWLEYQQNSQIKTERKMPYKFVWVDGK